MTTSLTVPLSHTDLLRAGFVLMEKEAFAGQMYWHERNASRVYAAPKWRSDEGYSPWVLCFPDQFLATLGALQWRLRRPDDLQKWLSKSLPVYCTLMIDCTPKIDHSSQLIDD